MSEQDLRPPQRTSSGAAPWLWGLVGIALLLGGGWYAREQWRAAQTEEAAPPVVAAAPAPPPLPDMPVDVLPSAPEPARDAVAALAPGPVHPLAGVQSSSAATVLGGANVEVDANSPATEVQPTLDELAVQWLGQQALQFVVTPGLAHHIVATVDNLPRGHVAPRLWPLHPVGGKMAILMDDAGAMQIDASNSARYDAVVNFVTGLDPAQVAQWYRQAYPVLQRSYEELGYPGQYFNDRLVQVMDHLLQTPQVSGPLAVQLVEVQGQIRPQQPWLRYEYVDPNLQMLSAGQRILLRLGAQHRQRISAYLQAVRGHIAAGAAATPSP